MFTIHDNFLCRSYNIDDIDNILRTQIAFSEKWKINRLRTLYKTSKFAEVWFRVNFYFQILMLFWNYCCLQRTACCCWCGCFIWNWKLTIQLNQEHSARARWSIEHFILYNCTEIVDRDDRNYKDWISDTACHWSSRCCFWSISATQEVAEYLQNCGNEALYFLSFYTLPSGYRVL